MMQETGVHVEPFVETSTPPFPPDREVAHRILQLPRDTLYAYLSGKSVQPGAETFRALKKRLCVLDVRKSSEHSDQRPPSTPALR